MALTFAVHLHLAGKNACRKFQQVKTCDTDFSTVNITITQARLKHQSYHRRGSGIMSSYSEPGNVQPVSRVARSPTPVKH